MICQLGGDFGVYLGVDLGVIVSMMVLSNASVVVEYDRRRSGLAS